jgi:predicted component of type VI protein secretion system
MKAKLILTSKDRQTVQEVPFDRPSITIGRKPNNDLAFNRPEISGSHAAFLFENSEYFVLDLGSTNGTLLNGAQLVAREKYGLQDKDVITVAPFTIQFVVEDESMDTMIEVSAQPPAAQKKIRSGTAPDLASAKPSQQAAPVSAPPPAPPPADPQVVQAAPVAPPAKAATPPAPQPQQKAATAARENVVIPEAKKGSSAVTDYLWLGIGAILVLAAIGLIIFILVGL